VTPRGTWRAPSPSTLLILWLVGGLGGGLLACGQGADDGSPGAKPPDTDTAPATGGAGLGLPVDLYFPTVDGRLAVESRELPPSSEPTARIQGLVEALLAGPRSADVGLVRPLPKDVTLEGVYLGPGGVAFLDLRTPEPRSPPSVGSREEMQIVYSLVNSVALNVAEARRVVLLWNGRQPGTFAGHLDTSHPLAPDTGLVRR